MKGAKLGQHFLNAQWPARELIGSLDVQGGETILEIGPGRGALTKELLKTGNKIVAVEKDPLLIPILHEAFAEEIRQGQLEVLEKDVRDIDADFLRALGSYVLAANIPYYITGEIIRAFLETSVQPRALSLLIQKEVAERIIARDEKESILSLSVKAYGTPSIVKTVPRGCFNPPPNVDSAILLVENISRQFFKEISEEAFFKVVKAGFASKRKQLGGNLEKVFGTEALDALTHAGIARTVRAEDVKLHEWERLVRGMGV